MVGLERKGQHKACPDYYIGTVNEVVNPEEMKGPKLIVSPVAEPKGFRPSNICWGQQRGNLVPCCNFRRMLR